MHHAEARHALLQARPAPPQLSARPDVGHRPSDCPGAQHRSFDHLGHIVVLGGDDITRLRPSLARADIPLAIDRDNAVKADTNPTKQAARLRPDRGSTPTEPARGEDNPRYRLTGPTRSLIPIQRESQWLRLIGPNRVRFGRKKSGRHYAASARYGASDARFTANDAISIGKEASTSQSVMPARSSSAVASESPIPAPSCPVACQRPGIR